MFAFLLGELIIIVFANVFPPSLLFVKNTGALCKVVEVAFVHAVYMSLPDTAIGAKNTGRQQIAFFWGLAGCNIEDKIAIVNIEIRVIEVIGASFFMLAS